MRIKELYYILPCLALMCVGIQVAKKLEKRKQGIYKFTLIVISFVYLCGVVYFTAISGPRRGLRGYRLKVMLPILWAFREPKYIPNAIVHVLNIFLLVPFGYLLPQLRQLPWWRVLLLGFCFSFLIESSQYIFHFGSFQTDDLMDNTIGAGVGYLIYRILNPTQ